MVVRLRVRHPSGTLQLQAEDGWTLAQLCDRIRADTRVAHFSLKTGFPPAPLDINDKASATLAELKLNGSTLVLTPIDPPEGSDAAIARALSEQEARDAFLAAEIAAAAGSSIPENRTAKPDNLSVSWPEMDGLMVLRVMADDNSCLFTALSSALAPGIANPAPHLRNQIAEYILARPETYTKAMLEKSPEQYTRNLRGKDFWGGSIEMSVLSDMYDIQIVAVDVKTGQAFPHGEDKKEMCLVLYSGIHYDRIVFTASADYPPETDVVRFDVSDESAIVRAKQLAERLRKTGYYTDTNTMLLRCEVPGCDWFGDVKAANEHNKATGHSAFDEIPDK